MAAGLGVDIGLTAWIRQFSSSGIPDLVVITPFVLVGVVVSRREPGNPIGWMILVAATAYVVCNDSGYYALAALQHGHRGLPAVRVAVALAPFGWLTLILLAPLPALLFPEGRLPSARWRWPLRAYLSIWAIVLVAMTIADTAAFTDRRLHVDSTGELEIFNHSTNWLAYVMKLAIPAYGALALSFVVALLLAYRRSTGERRQQLKWLMAGGMICVVGISFALAGGAPHSTIAKLLGSVAFVCVIALPAAIGIGILKYRLYDIDRLISRTLSYTIVTGVLVAVFAGVVVLTTDLLPFSSPVGVAASTLSAAALFNPLRRRVQRLVDRRFNRARYDAEAIVGAFVARLRDAVDLETVSCELLRAVELAIEPAHVSVWIRETRAKPPARAVSP
ncbi:MAG TPA: hypothetical protein VG265_14835 [Gaiellaceae bacterium]|nr:hypothetical protein [Gaiellaceae bacterium]